MIYNPTFIDCITGEPEENKDSLITRGKDGLKKLITSKPAPREIKIVNKYGITNVGTPISFNPKPLYSRIPPVFQTKVRYEDSEEIISWRPYQCFLENLNYPDLINKNNYSMVINLNRTINFIDFFNLKKEKYIGEARTTQILKTFPELKAFFYNYERFMALASHLYSQHIYFVNEIDSIINNLSMSKSLNVGNIRELKEQRRAMEEVFGESNNMEMEDV